MIQTQTASNGSVTWEMRVETLFGRMLDAGSELAGLYAAFAVLALLLKGRRRALADARAAAADGSLDLRYFWFDLVLVAPPIVALVGLMRQTVAAHDLALVATDSYRAMPALLELLLALLASDFIGYWRHRLLHSAALWPVHAIHHSPRAMNWLALARFHPLNRLLTTLLNAGVLALLGLPVWAILLNGAIRNYYGYVLHADIPWRFGPLRYVLVSPAMHRWHHVRDEALAQKNFATIFAFYDLAFGTFRVPAGPAPALGVDDAALPASWAGQMLYPLRCWGIAARRRLRPRGAENGSAVAAEGLPGNR
jgi:sterol desaturase/sphingolipid hydroxylase (fatty acid hydroxylase superfamily)